MRTLFGPVRYQMNIRSANSVRKKRSEAIPAFRLGFPDGSLRSTTFEREEAPPLLHLPAFPRPTRLTNGPLTDDVMMRIRPYGVDPREILSSTGATHVDSVLIKPEVFARFLAKIGHCVAVAYSGLTTFRPYLVPLILGDPDVRWNEFIGTRPTIEPHEHDMLHEALLWEVAPHDASTVYLVATLRLFAHLGTPTYEVVVGEKLPAIP